MRRQWIRIAAAIVGVMVAGCQTSNSSKSGASSASDSNSGQSSASGSTRAESSNESVNGSLGVTRDSLQTSEGTSAQSSESSKPSSESSKPRSESSKPSEPSGSEASVGLVLSATSVGITVGGLGLVIWHASRRVPDAPEPAAVGRAAQVYLRARTHQLREDLSLGAGPTIEDLAAMARIRRENLGTFGRLLRTHRGELLALADVSSLTPERALAWLERVGQLARTEPRLEEDRRAFFAAHGLLD